MIDGLFAFDVLPRLLVDVSKELLGGGADSYSMMLLAEPVASLPEPMRGHCC